MSKIGRQTTGRSTPQRTKPLDHSVRSRTGLYRPKAQPAEPDISSTYRLFIKSLKLIRRHARLLIGITLVYVLLMGVIVQKVDLLITSPEGDTVGERITSLSSTGSDGGLSDGGTMLQVGIFVICSLALLWALRRIQERQRASRVKDAFYKGMTPLIPYALVLLVVFVQLLPFAIFGSVFQTTITDPDFAATAAQQAFWFMLFLAATLWTVYMISASLQALFFVTEDGVTPMDALRRARRLVYKRRWIVMRKILVLPVVYTIFMSLIIVPFALIAPITLRLLFLLLNGALLLVSFTFFYILNRELRQ